MKLFTSLRTVLSLLLLMPMMALAQIEAGKVYMFMNAGNPGKAMAPGSSSNVTITNADESSISQRWYVEATGTSFRLRSMGTGQYLRSSKATSANWTLVNTYDSNCTLDLHTSGDKLTFRAKGDSNTRGYMHYGNGTGTIVCWGTDASATLWTVTEIEMTAEEIEQNWKELEEVNFTTEQYNGWKAALATLFKDKACTQLADAYATYTSAQMMEDENYLALPKALQNMVLKMTTDGTWDEANIDPSKPKWDAEYAKRLRVQLVEPYCSKEEAAASLHMNAHANLNNPLGLYANGRQTLYIMVEGSIEPGATLYLGTWTGHSKPGGKTDGYRLVEGLNIIPNFADGMTGCINYVVNAFDGGKRGNKARQMSLKAFKDIKVHIEGGNLNGYFNLMGDELWGEGDDNADWDYYAARATHTCMPLLGQYMTLQFPFFSADCVSLDKEGNVEGTSKGLDELFTGKNIAKQSLIEWDNVMLWERLVMGLASKEEVDRANAIWKSPYSGKDEVISHTGHLTDGYASDYEDYYRIHGLAFGVPTGYMYGSWDHSGYNYNTMEPILVSMITDSGSHWGPAHEIGHQHQEPFTLNGLMEVTNNLFANVALWYFGKSTSRVNGDDGKLENVAKAFNQKDGDFYTNNIWALTHMYFRLFLYYHVLGHNTEFYPRLYEMMRQNHMERVNQANGIQTGERGLLLFYRMACDAAREDLTEFFRGHGLLTPMNERFVGDYSNSIYTSTPEEIANAIASVKAKGYKENMTPLFINDGTGQKAIGSTGKELEHYDLYNNGTKWLSADVGHYAYFYVPATNYTFAVTSSGAIQMTGEGGIGFVVRNEKGELLAFSNKKTMEVSEEVGLQLIRGEVKIEAINGDGTFVDVEGDIAESTRTLLKQVIDKANEMCSTAEQKYNKVGFYRSVYLEKLEGLLAVAQEIYDESKVTEYATAYEQLLDEIDAINKNPEAVVGFMDGEAYQITTYENHKKAIEVASTSDRLLTGAKISSTSKAQRWYFEKAEEEGTYYLKNVMTGTYIDAIGGGTQGTALTKTDKVAFKVIKKEQGVFALECQDENKKGLNYNPSSSKILGWGHDDTNSWWYITAKTINTPDLEKIELKDLIKRTSNLLHEMGDNVILPGDMPLQVNDASARYYLSTNADQNVVGATKLGDGIASVLDGDTYTFLHTQRDGDKVSGYHNLTVDLGEGAELTDFTFKFATPNFDSGTATPVPSKIRVRGSVDGESYTTITTISSGMPSYTKKGVTWTSDSIKADEPYRYFRYEVMTSTGPGTTSYGRAFFSISEFSMQSLSTVIKSLKENYKGAEALYEETAVELNNAMGVSANSDASSTEVSNALENLQAKYDALHNAYLTDIEGVEVNTNKQQGIYDLFGRRVNQIATPGLYIINGKKQFVK